MSSEPFSVFGSINVFARTVEEIVTARPARNLSDTGSGQVIFQNKNFHCLLLRKV
jgi:hypothetical protein